MSKSTPRFEGDYPIQWRSSKWWSRIIKNLENDTPLFGFLIRGRALRKIIRRSKFRWSNAAQLLAYVYIKTPYQNLQNRTRLTLRRIISTDNRDFIWQVWAETRHPDLETLLIRKGRPARMPLRLFLLSALLITPKEDIHNIRPTPERIPDLVAFCQDPDSRIRQKAQRLLKSIREKAALQRLSDVFFQTGNPIALEILKEQAFQPKDLHQQVALTFLMEDLSTYDLLDFDHRVLSLIYNEAQPDLRHRIMRIIQTHGRLDLLPAITQVHTTALSEVFTPQEAQTLFEMHAQVANWDRLWELVLELPPKWSMICLYKLIEVDFQPPKTPDRKTFSRLCQLLAELPDPETIEQKGLFPVAVQSAQIKVNGRINDIDFAPTKPHIAIGTGLGRVAIWDFQNAQILSKHKDFDHSIGNLTYLPNGALACGERSNPDGPCAVKLIHNGKIVKLGMHNASIKTLTALPDNTLLSTSSDQQIYLWDSITKSQIAAKAVYPYPRAVIPWPGGNAVLMLSQNLHKMTLPDMAHHELRRRVEPGPHSRMYRSSMGVCASFLPSDDAFFMGQNNGLIWHYHKKGKTYYCNGTIVANHDKKVRNMCYLADQGILISGGAEGCLHFIKWPEGLILKTIELPEKNLTSLHISQDNGFMATGNSSAEMSLWDIRGLFLTNLECYDFANSRPSEIAAIKGLQEEPTLTKTSQNLLKYFQTVLLHRHQNDISIETAPQIKRGQFDIIIDEE